MRQFFLQIAVLTGIMLLSAVGHAQQLVYTLGSGDEVRITVFGEEDLSGKFAVGGEGQLSLPLIGSIAAVGKSLAQLEEDVTALLADGYLKQPRVNVEVLNYRPFYIMGEVKEPGSYPYVSGMTIMNAVALGAGFTHRAKKEEISIVRAADPSQTPKTVSPESTVLPGDIIRIEERFF